jgi:hypothetical protein
MAYQIRAKTTGVIFCDDLKTKEEAEKNLLTIQGLIAISGIKTDYIADDFEIVNASS